MQHSSLKKKSVLVVDDAAFVRNLIIGALKTINIIQIKEASDGRQAYAALQTKHYDLVISDWHMPEMEGIELLKKVRSNERLKNTPFIMLTSDVTTENVKQAIAAGVDEYLTKPFRNDALLEKVLRLFGAA